MYQIMVTVVANNSSPTIQVLSFDNIDAADLAYENICKSYRKSVSISYWIIKLYQTEE